MLKIVSSHHGEPEYDLTVQGIETPDALADKFVVDIKAVNRVISKYPMRINPYFLSLIKKADDPLGRQVIEFSFGHRVLIR